MSDLKIFRLAFRLGHKPATIEMHGERNEGVELRVYNRSQKFVGFTSNRRTLRALARAILRAIGDEP